MSEPERKFTVVDTESGEQLDACPACSARDDVIDGLERKVRGLIMENAKLRRAKEKEARDSGLWPVAVRLFALWKKAAGSTRSQFSYDRFATVEPFIRKVNAAKHFVSPEAGPPSNPLEECVAAIIGRTFDCYSTTRTNGTVKKFNEFERIFDSRKEMEESRDRRPRDWRKRALELDPELAPPTPTEAPAEQPASYSPEQTALLRPVDKPQSAPPSSG